MRMMMAMMMMMMMKILTVAAGWIVHCSMLAEDAIKSAISNYYTKNPQTKTTNLAGTAAKMPTGGAEAMAASG